jgi:NAD(P)-dependent dehydrogenase (short-subunit alcohol dehydrogenase family)
MESDDPKALVDELKDRDIYIDAVVSNDVYPITRTPIGAIALEDLRNTFEAVLVFPVQLTQLLLPEMKARKSGSFVFVTSARPLRPELGFAVPTSIRAGATAFALALAREVVSFGIQVNVVAPNYLYSEMYYPRARFIDDPQGREHIAGIVPMGRLGTPEEVGELIAFLASGRSCFITGQVIYFTGGWP